ncbi:hypothetical protein O9992_15080 [Vibrio lentus]|nr:hypothetical protein [Vibrio lentus]
MAEKTATLTCAAVNIPNNASFCDGTRKQFTAAQVGQEGPESFYIKQLHELITCCKPV